MTCPAALNIQGKHIGCDHPSHPHPPHAHSSRVHSALWMGADEVMALDPDPDDEREIR